MAEEKAPQFADFAKSLPATMPDEAWNSVRDQWFDGVLWPWAKAQGAKQGQYPETLRKFQENASRPGKTDYPKTKLAATTAGSALMKPLAKAVDNSIGSETHKGLRDLDANAEMTATRQGVSDMGVMGSKLAGGAIGAAPYFIPAARATAALGAARLPAWAAGALEGGAGGAGYEALASEAGKEGEAALHGGIGGAILGGATGGLTQALASIKARMAAEGGANPTAAAAPAPRQLPAPPERGVTQQQPASGFSFGGPRETSAEYMGWPNRQLSEAPPIDAEFSDMGPPPRLLERGVMPMPSRPAAGELPAPGASPLRSEGRLVVDEPPQDFLMRNERRTIRDRIVEGTAEAEQRGRITAYDQTTTETPATLEAQLKQLEAKTRGVVMLPESAEGLTVPKGNRVITVEGSGKFVYDPSFIKAGELRKAIEENRLTEVLGARDGGYGAPDKTMLGDGQVVAVARDMDGVVTQEVVTDAANLPKTVDQLRKLGSVVDIEPIEQTLMRRKLENELGVLNGKTNGQGAGEAKSLEGVQYGEISEPRPPAGKIAVGSERPYALPGGEGRFIQTRNTVREFDDVFPSHDPATLELNKGYQLLNARRFNDPESVADIDKLSAEFDPGNSEFVTDADGNLIDGNKRFIALARAKQEVYDAYRTVLQNSAASHGVDPAQVAAMRRPVLVREIPDAEFDRMASDPPAMPSNEALAAAADDIARANTGMGSGVASDPIAMRDRPTGMQGTTGGQPIPGMPEGVSAVTYEAGPGKAATMLREPSRIDQFHESIHRGIVEQAIDAETVFKLADPAMASKLTNALPELSGGRAGLYRGIEHEEVATRLFTAVRTGDDAVIDAFVKADGSKEEVMAFAAKQAEAFQADLALRAESPQRRILERKLQDVRRRASRSIDDLADDLAVMDGDIRVEADGKMFVRTGEEKGYRVFEDREKLTDFMERNGEWPEAPEFVSAEGAAAGSGGLPPTGGPRMRFNTEPDAPAAPVEAPRLGPNWFSFMFRPALAWYQDTATKLGMPELYRQRVKLDDGARFAQVAHHAAMEKVIALKAKYKISVDRASDLWFIQTARRLEAEGFTGGPTFEAVNRIAKNLKLSDKENAFLEDLRPVLDDLGRDFGISPERWSKEYISVMRKMQNDPDFSLNNYKPPADLKFFAEEVFRGRTGNLETNLFRVVDTYARLGYRKKFMEEPYRALHKLVNQTKPGESDMMGLLRQRMNRDLEFMRGMPDKGQKAMESGMAAAIEGLNARMKSMRDAAPAWAKPAFKNIETPPDEAMRKLVLLQYAGSMGGRVKTWTMNMLQPMLSFPLMDSENFAFGMANALSKENIARARRFDVLASEADMSQMAAGEETGISGMLGKIAQKSLAPQRWTDNVTRLVTFGGFHRQVERAVKQFKAISEPGPEHLKSFISKSSMQYLDPIMAQDFAKEIVGATTKADLEAITGRIAHRLTESTQWSFTRGAAPGTYKFGVGRVLGMYGTWPMNFVEYLRRSMANPQLTPFERAKTIGKFVAVNAAILEAGKQAGVNLHSQVYLGAMAYSGGPTLSAVLNLPTAAGDWETRRGDESRSNVLKPVQTFVPGYIAFSQLAKAISDSDNHTMWETILEAQGYRTTEDDE